MVDITKSPDCKHLLVKELDRGKWEADIGEFNYSLFISPEWVSSMSFSQGSPVFLDFVDADRVFGKLSGLFIKGGKALGNQLFFYAYPAIRTNEESLLNACMKTLLLYAKSRKVQRIIIGSYDQQNGIKCKVKGFIANERYEYVVDLQPESGKIAFSQNLKRNVKKAQKQGAILAESEDPKLVGRLSALLNSTLDKRANKYGHKYNPFYLPYLNPGSVERLLANKAGRFYYSGMNEDGAMHCLLFNLERDGKAFNLLAGSDELSYQNGLASWLDYSIIEQYREKGQSYYNLGGGTGDAGSEGLERSKQSKGGVKKIVYGATTNFLLYPHKLLNPLLNLGRFFKKLKLI